MATLYKDAVRAPAVVSRRAEHAGRAQCACRGCVAKEVSDRHFSLTAFSWLCNGSLCSVRRMTLASGALRCR